MFPLQAHGHGNLDENPPMSPLPWSKWSAYGGGKNTNACHSPWSCANNFFPSNSASSHSVTGDFNQKKMFVGIKYCLGA